MGTNWAFTANGDTYVTVEGLLFFYVSSGTSISVQGGKLNVESSETWTRLRTGLRTVVSDNEVLARLEKGLKSKFAMQPPHPAPPPPRPAMKTPTELGLADAAGGGAGGRRLAPPRSVP